MPAMWSAVSVTSVPTGYLGSAAVVIPSGTGRPCIGCSIPPWLSWPSWLSEAAAASCPPLLSPDEQPVRTRAPLSAPAASDTRRRLFMGDSLPCVVACSFEEMDSALPDACEKRGVCPADRYAAVV